MLKPNNSPKISIVIPIYNESENIADLDSRLNNVLKTLNLSYEIIYVDDGSSDGSIDLLKTICQTNVNVRTIRLQRNFGQHAAIFAGFKHVTGDLIVTLDADLQNPPEEIPKLISALNPEIDVVATWRQQRNDNLWRRITSRAINTLINAILKSNLKDYGCMLRLYRRSVVEAMLKIQDKTLFIPALASWLKFRIKEIPVQHTERKKGKSKYPIFHLLRLNFDLITTMSILPIQAISFLGLISAGFGLLLGFYILYRRFVLGPEVEGVFTLFAFTFILFGILLIVLGIIGEYIARIHLQVTNRPLFIEKEIISIKSNENSTSGYCDKKNVILFAYHNIGCQTLRTLSQMENINIAAVVTHKDQADENIWFSSVQELAFARNIPVLRPDDVNQAEFIERIRDFHPDLLISAHFRQIFSQPLLSTAKYGGVNLHTSLLPKYRGRAPINWVIIQGETETGITLHKMKQKVDCGEIYIQKRVEISMEDTALSLYDKLCQIIPDVLPEGIRRVFDPAFTPTVQDESRATYFGRREPKDGLINWDKPALEIYNLVRAVTRPYPGAFSQLANGEKLYMWRAKILPQCSKINPGFLAGWNKENPVVATATNDLEICEYEFSGKEQSLNAHFRS